MLKRESGILLHFTSLPSKYGIGDLGQHAYKFVDFLAAGNQRLWQILPINPTGFKDSPYQSFSTFAGNPLLIDPEALVKWGLLTTEELANVPAFPIEGIDYGPVIEFKNSLYRQAYGRFVSEGEAVLRTAFDQFVTENATWIHDFALFMALKSHFIAERKFHYETPEQHAFASENADALDEAQINDYYYGAVWQSWPTDIGNREPQAIAHWTAELSDEIGYHQFLQFVFATQYAELKKYANDKYIKIIGDIPIFVALDSSDVWANPKEFLLDGKGNPTGVAGVPPDYFSEDGQLWGNPLYDWSAMQATNYKWWIDRIKAALQFCDIIRIDHFRGFDAYWQVPYGAKTARNGAWIPAPGQDLFRVIKEQLGDLPIIAEDLGVITPEVEALRDDYKLPGMKVIQFGFDGGCDNEHLPLHYNTSHAVVYTGTHDNDTTIGWYQSQNPLVQDQVRRFMNVSGDDVAWDMIRLAFLNPLKMAVVPMQDVLRQDSRSRMNTPGTADGNWQYRILADALKPELSAQLAYLSDISDRNL